MFLSVLSQRKKKLVLLRNPIFYPKIETSHLAAGSSAALWVSACRALGHPCPMPGSSLLPLARIPSVAVKGQHWRQSQHYPEIANFVPVVASDLMPLGLLQGGEGFGGTHR